MSTKGMMKGGKGMMKAGGKGMMGKAGMMMGAMMGMGNDQKGKLAMPPVPAIPSVPTAAPTLTLAQQQEQVTCISVIDENNGRNTDADWATFRATWPDRPFCLLQPVPASGLFVPTNFTNDTVVNVFSEVTRGALDATNTSSWYDICNLDNSRLNGLTKVILFVDNSGSLVTADVQNAFDLFATEINASGLEIVAAVENSSEDYISPCLLTNITASSGNSTSVP